MKTLEEVLETIQRNCIDNPDVTEVVGIFSSPTDISYYSFFDSQKNRYRVIRKRTILAQPDTATEFYVDEYVQPVLDLLNTKAAHLLPPGKSKYVVEEDKSRPQLYVERKDFEVTLKYLNGDKIRLARDDRNAVNDFDSLDALMEEVFKDVPNGEPDKYALLRPKIALAISDASKRYDKNKKRAENTLNTLKKHAECLTAAVEKIPPEIRLLVELGEVK